MTYFISTFLGVSSFVKKKSNVLMLLMLVYAFIMFTFTTENPDYSLYYHQYYWGGVFTEPVYVETATMFKSFGFEYQALRIFFVTIGLLLVSKTIYDYSPYPATIMFFYIFYPMPVDVVQIRTFLSNAIMIFCIRFIINYNKTGKKRYFFYYLLGMLFAIGIHYATALFFILLILFYKTDKHKIFFYIVLPIAFIVLLSNLLYFESIIEFVIGKHKADLWFGDQRVITFNRVVKILTPKIIFVLMLVLVKVNTNLHIPDHSMVQGASARPGLPTAQQEDKFADPEVSKCFLNVALYVQLLNLLDIVYMGDYERLIRVSLICGLIYMSRIIYINKYRNKVILWLVLIVVYTIYFLFIMFGNTAKGDIYFNYVFRNVMENNPLY